MSQIAKIIHLYYRDIYEKEGGELAKDNLDTLYLKHSKMVYHFLFHMIENHELTEELTQETFYQAFLSYPNFRGECKASTWLCQIAKNVWLQYLRKHKLTDSLDNYVDSIVQNEALDPLKIYIQKEEKELLYSSIKFLPQEMQDVVVLRISTELSFSEIADLLEKSETWARTNFYRAKKKLKDIGLERS